MKNIWRKKQKCGTVGLDFWEDEELDMNKNHVKASMTSVPLLYGGFFDRGC